MRESYQLLNFLNIRKQRTYFLMTLIVILKGEFFLTFWVVLIKFFVFNNLELTFWKWKLTFWYEIIIVSVIDSYMKQIYFCTEKSTVFWLRKEQCMIGGQLDVIWTIDYEMGETGILFKEWLNHSSGLRIPETSTLPPLTDKKCQWTSNFCSECLIMSIM